MPLFALAYPQLSQKDFNLIQNCRMVNDMAKHKIVQPHFTLVFAVPDFSAEDFVKEIKMRSNGFGAIEFEMHSSTVDKNIVTGEFHVFLVPDEGYEKITDLHDGLYSRTLNKYLRTDIPYIPHITIATKDDENACHKIADEWNNLAFSIRGKIQELSVVQYGNDKIDILEIIQL